MMNESAIDLWDYVEKVHAGAIDPARYRDHCLTRIAALNPQLNALRRLVETSDPTPLKTTPLAGAALAHKDMFWREGRLSGCGAKIMAEHRPKRTATVLKRLDAAGALEIAALSMSEFAQAPTGHNGHYGAVRNPHDLSRVSGGSSSGSGAAVAAGLVLGSLGSDTGGSIRIPASVCGVTGLKPTWGRVPLTGVMPLAPSFDCVGPLARSARDCALLMGVIAGEDREDGDSARIAVPDYKAKLNGDLRGLRIGLPDRWFLEGVSPAIERNFEAALAQLQARGASLHPISLPHLDHVIACAGVASRVEVAAQHRHFMRSRPQDYAVQVSARMYPGYAIPGTMYVEAMRQRAGLLRAFVRDVFAQVDVIATPTLKAAPPTIAESDVEAGVEGAVAKFLALSSNTRQISFLGLPAISLPMGLCDQKLPSGLQLIARPFGEARLLQAGEAFQRDSNWHLTAPQETPWTLC